jgi:2-oxoglutarate dehydrogenase E2 component (dihydrolipoamide succinyltransferase)
MSFAQVEKTIADFGKRAKDGTLKIEEMRGGTFTITNGGVFGSLMSTRSSTRPRAAVLGMHRIEERPGGPRRPDRDQADDVPGALLRPPPRRRPRGSDVPGRIKEALEDPMRLLIDL